MNTRCCLVACAVVSALALATPDSSAQQSVLTPNGAIIQGVSGDGSRVVGTYNGEAFYWDWRVDPAPTPIGGRLARATSDDGTAIIGGIDDPITGELVAARWTQATGWVSLGGLDSCSGSISSARAISSDGQSVVGSMWDGCTSVGFLWTVGGGLVPLQSAGVGAGSSLAQAIAGDGSKIGGWAFGNSGRTPATWDPVNQNGFVPDPDDQGEIAALNGDGTLSVGSRYASGGTLTAFVHSGVTGYVNLGSLDPAWGSIALDLSDAGDVIVGNDKLLLATRPWIYRLGQGQESLHDVLIELGIHPGLELINVAGVSDDGNVVVGNAAILHGLPELGIISELAPQDLVWEDLGGDTNGINGHPQLSGTGTLIDGAPTAIDLVNGPAGALSVVWTSLVSVPFPVAGGVLYANPNVSEILIPLDPAGEFHAAFPWFSGVPSGLSLHFQFLIQDTSRVYGFSMSNGLKATAP